MGVLADNLLTESYLAFADRHCRSSRSGRRAT